MCDRAFPEREGWFSEFYAESRTWIATPPWFRSWIEHEQRTTALRVWQLGVLSGLLQTADYARAILAVEPGVTEDEVGARLAARLERQATLTRDDPPAAWFLVDRAMGRQALALLGQLDAACASAEDLEHAAAESLTCIRTPGSSPASQGSAQ